EREGGEESLEEGQEGRPEGRQESEEGCQEGQEGSQEGEEGKEGLGHHPIWRGADAAPLFHSPQGRIAVFSPPPPRAICPRIWGNRSSGASSVMSILGSTCPSAIRRNAFRTLSGVWWNVDLIVSSW